MNNSRRAAAKIILEVIAGHRSLDTALAHTPLTGFSDEDSRFVQELCYGTLRFYPELLGITLSLLHKPLADKHQDVLCVLLLGVYQLLHLNTPAYAAISSTVQAAKALKKSWAPGLVNKILRLCAERQENLRELIHQREEWRYAHPPWLIGKIKKNWPNDWSSLLEANNQAAPCVLRVNPQKISRDAYLECLLKADIEAKSLPELPYALQLMARTNVTKLPGFDSGWFYVQDSAGQHASNLLQLAPGQTVLDACAAPGSKTTDILIREPKLAALIAVDISPDRLTRIKENVTRLQLDASPLTLLCADANGLSSQYAVEHFDRILLDAPCSATGVIRRHPDIKVLRQPSDIPAQAKAQLALLTALWPLLKPGGLCLYSTCSVLTEENDAVVDKFLKTTPNAKVEALPLDSAHKLTFGYQFLPKIQGSDGFYYALIKKLADCPVD